MDPATRVAIVDDDPSVRKALDRLLTARSFRTETFASADAFLRSLPAGPPDCLVLDLQMPGMTGLELQQHLRREGPRVPVIVITAQEEAGLSERCRAAGAAAILFKPLDGDVLVGAIRDAVGRA